MRRMGRATNLCRHRLRLLASLSLLGVPLGAQTTAPVAVDAVCIGPDGKPVAGVEFADRWSCVDGVWRASFQCPDPQHPLRLVSDANGRLTGTWTFSPMETPLFGWSPDRSLALRVLPSTDAVTHGLEVRGTLAMVRTVRVRGVVRAAALTATRLSVRWPAPEADWSATFLFACDRPAFELPLPPGCFGLIASAGHGASASRTLALAPGREVLDVGEIHVPLPAFDLPGEVLPDWHVDAAKNLPLAAATLAHFRGAPLLLHFDDFGFPPRLEQAAREALAALDRHPARARFHVVLFGPVRNRLEGLPERPANAEFDRLLPRPKPGVPPIETMFPLLTDDSGATERLYGSAWGTAVLDRDGRLVCHGTLAEAIASLERLLAEER